MTDQFYAGRLRALENAIRTAGYDAYIVPMVDEFQGEYIPAYAARLPYITGFTGSAGMALIWAQPSAERRHTLFVDGRYTLQAANEVSADEFIILNSGEVSLADRVNASAEIPLKIGVDAWLIGMGQWQRWQEATAYTQVEWIAGRPNLVDGIWSDQPATPAGEVILHPLEYAGVTYAEKRTNMMGAAW